MIEIAHIFSFDRKNLTYSIDYILYKNNNNIYKIRAYY